MKGLFLGISLIFLAIAILTLSQNILESNLSQRSDVNRIAVFDRIIDERKYIENGFEGIVGAANIKVISTSTSLSISEPFPNGNVTNFRENIAIWKDFVENISSFSVKINTTEINKTLPIYINGIKFEHGNGFGGNVVNITNTSIVTRYTVLLEITNNGQIQVKSEYSAGNDELLLFVNSGNESYSSISYLNFSMQNNFTVTYFVYATTPTDIIPRPFILFVGDKKDRGTLSLKNNDSYTSRYEINMTFPEQKSDAVTLGYESINITASQFNISTISSIRIE